MRFLFLLLLAVNLRAELVDPLLWEQLVERADFVGVIECEVAGGIVAKYKVVDAWKGGTNGDNLSFYITPNEFGPRYPIVLCGTRVLVAGTRVQAGEKLARRPSMFSLPLWWREIPADYKLAPLSDTTAPAIDAAKDTAALAAFRTQVVDFLKLPPSRREFLLIKALSAKYLLRLQQEIAVFPEGRDENLMQLQEKVKNSTNLSQIVTNLLSYPESTRQTKLETIETIIRQGGRQETIALLERTRAESTSFSESRLKQLLASVKANLAPPPRPRLRKAPALVFGPQEAEDLLADPTSTQFSSAFAAAANQQPDRAIDVLLSWSVPETANEEVIHYKAASLYCVQDKRKNHYADLLTAKSPMMRATAASYSSALDFGKAKPVLDKLLQVESPAALYAAFALARRGEKPAMKKLIESIGNQLQPFSLEYLWQSQALVLLSNSARTSGLPQPVSDLSETSTKKLLAWWNAHQAKLKLADPWLPILQEQGID